MRGTLDEGALPGLLRDLHVRHQTGHLHLSRGSAARLLVFRRGQIVRADRVDEGLVRQGLLDAAQLSEARKAALRERKPLARALEERGIASPDALQEALARHVRECLRDALDWRDGRFEFEAHDALAPFEDDLILAAPTAGLILEVARQVTDPRLVERALGDQDRILQLSTDPMVRFQKMALTPDEALVLARIDGIESAASVLAQLALAPSAGRSSLFALLSTGVVEYVEGTREPRPAPERPVLAAPQRAPAPERPPVPPPAPPPVRVATEADLRRREILTLHQRIPLRSHFEVLGIPQTASAADVKEAYFALAKRFHPDAHGDPALADLKDVLEAVFIRLGQAYEVLRNARSRGVHEADLAARTPSAEPAASSGASPARSPEPDPAAQAAQDVRKAEKLQLQEKHWDAIQLLEPAIPHLAGKMRQRGQVALAQAYARNPKWTRRAEKVLSEVVTEEPANVQAHLLLAGLYRTGGLKARALTAYRRVLELDPENEAAQVALAEMTEGEPAPAQPPGLFKKIFGKG